jgi:hypothetical protein
MTEVKAAAERKELPEANYGQPAALAALRPRLYKAIRATILGLEGQSARRRLFERWLGALFQEGPQKLSFPEELAEAQQAAFQAALDRAVNRGRRLVLLGPGRRRLGAGFAKGGGPGGPGG